MKRVVSYFKRHQTCFLGWNEPTVIDPTIMKPIIPATQNNCQATAKEKWDQRSVEIVEKLSTPNELNTNLCWNRSKTAATSQHPKKERVEAAAVRCRNQPKTY